MFGSTCWRTCHSRSEENARLTLKLVAFVIVWNRCVKLSIKMTPNWARLLSTGVSWAELKDKIKKKEDRLQVGVTVWGTTGPPSHPLWPAVWCLLLLWGTTGCLEGHDPLSGCLEWCEPLSGCLDWRDPLSGCLDWGGPLSDAYCYTHMTVLFRTMKRESLLNT